MAFALRGGISYFVCMLSVVNSVINRTVQCNDLYIVNFTHILNWKLWQKIAEWMEFPLVRGSWIVLTSRRAHCRHHRDNWKKKESKSMRKIKPKLLSRLSIRKAHMRTINQTKHLVRLLSCDFANGFVTVFISRFCWPTQFICLPIRRRLDGAL